MLVRAVVRVFSTPVMTSLVSVSPGLQPGGSFSTGTETGAKVVFDGHPSLLLFLESLPPFVGVAAEDNFKPLQSYNVLSCSPLRVLGLA